MQQRFERSRALSGLNPWLVQFHLARMVLWPKTLGRDLGKLDSRGEDKRAPEYVVDQFMG